jgi:hypothetical protein
MMSDLRAGRPGGAEDSGRRERDYGDSAGYGTGGSALDYRDVVGGDESGLTERRPNPLDAVMDMRRTRHTGAGPVLGEEGEEALASGLGLFSIALGVTEVVAAPSLARFLGMENRTEWLRAYGVREIAMGIGILSQPRPRGWLWARAAGDLLDIATLVPALAEENPKRGRAAAAVGAIVAVAALDVICASLVGRGGDRA